MNFEEILIKSTLRNLRTYINYILSSASAIFIFFITSSLINHPVINQHNGEDIKLAILYTKLGVFIISIFFIIYSIDLFVKMQKKNFGIFLALGVDKVKFYKIFIIENLIIGGISLILGIIFGVIFLKLFLIIFSSITNIDNIKFYLPVSSIIESIIVYGIVFFLISIYECKKVLEENCIELLKNNKSTNIKISKIFKVLFLILNIMSIIMFSIMIIYRDAKFMNYAKLIFMPLVLISLNIFLLKYIIPWIIQVLSNLKWIKLKGNNIILFASVKESFINMANIIVLVTFLFTVTFFIISINYVNIVTVKSNLEMEIPSTYNIIIKNKRQSIPFENELESLLEMKNFKYDKSKCKILLTGEKYDDISLISNSDYNKLAILSNRKTIEVKEDKSFLVPIFFTDYVRVKILNILDEELIVNNQQVENVVYGIFNNNLYVVSDEFYKKFEKQLDYIYYVAYNLEDWTDATSIIEEVRQQYYKYDEDKQFYMISRVTRYEENMLSAKIVMYFSILVCILLYFMALSLLHIRFYNEKINNQYNFKNLKSIGITNKEIKQIISKEMTIVFFIPYIIGILNTYIFMNIIKNIYVIDITKQIQFILISILIFNTLYFFLWRFKSIDKILSELQ